MSSVKSWMVGVVAGAATFGSVGAFAQAQAPTLVVGSHSQMVQTPTTVPSGVVYQATGAQTSTLTVYTDGFFFCGNFLSGDPNQLPLKLALGHEDQSPLLGSAHKWAMPGVLAESFIYNNGRFIINPGLSASTLGCLSLSKQGEVVSGLVEGIFDNGYDSKAETNYNHLVNWKAPVGFDWSAPDWSQVPADACGGDAYEHAKASEDVGCAAVTGVQAGEVRAPKMWTVTNGTTFTYIFRLHARLGVPAPGAQATAQPPALNSQFEPDGSILNMKVLVKDAYDKDFLSSTGNYCYMNALPQTVDTNVCSTAGVSVATIPADGFLPIELSVLDQQAQMFYVAVNRQVSGVHQDTATPVAAASILVEPAATLENADKFIGDNVVFGFMPSSSGFPWMSGQ